MEFVRRLLSRLDAGWKIRVSEIDLLGEAEGVRVGLNDVHELLGVSAAHAGNNRHTILMSGLQNNTIASLTSLPAYSQLAELVRGEDVNPRLVEHETGLYFIHEFLQCIFQCAQIEFIVRAIGQWDVEIRLLFLRRVIVRTVHAECKDSFLVPEDPGRSIALMNVEVYDQNGSRRIRLQKNIGGDSHIVEQTKTCAVVRERVVGASGDIHRDAIPGGIPCTLNRPVNDQQFAVHYPFVKGETRPPDLLRRKSEFNKPTEIIGIVGEQYGIGINRAGMKYIFSTERTFVKQLLRQDLVLAHGEAVMRGQWQNVRWIPGYL